MKRLRRLFEPIVVGRIELKNRIVMLGTTVGFADDHKITDQVTNFYAARAKGGASLITIGSMSVSDVSSAKLSYKLYNHTLGIYDDELIPGLHKLTSSIHANGAKVCAQLATGYEWRRSKNAPMESVSASNGVRNMFTPPARALNIDEIHQIVEEYGEAARRAREAGFDMVELSGYVLHHFLSPYSNRRTDEYGGSPENRLRFILEIIDCVKRKAGHDYTIGHRLVADEFKPGGITIEESKTMASILEKAGVDYITTYVGAHESLVPTIQSSVPPGAFVYLAQELKKAVHIPVVASNRISDPFLAENIVAKGRADLVGMARALFADPELPNKAREGRYDEIRPCITCCRCLDNAFEGRDVACSVNANVEREMEFAVEEPTREAKRVLIIGGGPAGMETARVAALRGHKVTIYEKDRRLGGSMILASVLNPEIEKFVTYMRSQIRKLPIDVKTGKEQTIALLEQMKPEVVVLASGGVPSALDVPGCNLDNVVSIQHIRDFMSGKPPKKLGIANRLLWSLASVFVRYLYQSSLVRRLLKLGFPFGKRVVVVGGGFAGCELGEFLVDKGRRVTIVEQSGHIGSDIGVTTRWVTMKRLREAGVRVETNANVVEITKKGVKISHAGSCSFLESDTVALVAGLRANDKFCGQLQQRSSILYCVGDCAEPGKIMEAVAAGFSAGRKIGLTSLG